MTPLIQPADIEFNVVFDDAEQPDDSFLGCVQFTDYPDIKRGRLKLINPDELLTPLTDLTLHMYRYLPQPILVPIHNPAGFTRIALLAELYKAWKRIYTRPTDSQFIETVNISPDGAVTMHIGS